MALYDNILEIITIFFFIIENELSICTNKIQRTFFKIKLRKMLDDFKQ